MRVSEIPKALLAGFCILSLNIATLSLAKAQVPPEFQIEPADSAPTPTSIKPPVAPPPEPTPSLPSKASKINEGFHAGLVISLLDTWVPFKVGALGGYTTQGGHSFELEYTRASFSAAFMGVDTGSIAEQRIAAVYRHFFGGSFNLIFGLSYNDFKVELGSEELEDVTADERAHVDLFQISNLGLEFGLSNRWHPFSKNFILQVDWIGFNIPISTFHKKTGIIDATSDPHMKDVFKDIFDLIDGLPRGYFMKFTLGWAF